MISANQYFKESSKFGGDFHPDFIKGYVNGVMDCGFLKPVRFEGPWPGGYLCYSIKQQTKKQFELCFSDHDDWCVRKKFTSRQQILAYLSYFEQWGDTYTIESEFTNL